MYEKFLFKGESWKVLDGSGEGSDALSRKDVLRKLDSVLPPGN